MTNLSLLKRYIEYSGMKLNVLSYKLGMSRTTLWSRLNGHSEFTSDEIRDICKVLRLNEKERENIFGTISGDHKRKQYRG